MVKVLSIHPIYRKYFIDKSELDFLSLTYQGIYNYTPVYPRYTFFSNRFNYMTQQNVIEFITMLPIKRLLSEYFVEVRIEMIVDVRNENSLNVLIERFNEFCIKRIEDMDIDELIKNAIDG